LITATITDPYFIFQFDIDSHFFKNSPSAYRNFHSSIIATINPISIPHWLLSEPLSLVLIIIDERQTSTSSAACPPKHNIKLFQRTQTSARQSSRTRNHQQSTPECTLHQATVQRLETYGPERHQRDLGRSILLLSERSAMLRERFLDQYRLHRSGVVLLEFSEGWRSLQLSRRNSPASEQTYKQNACSLVQTVT
jgi:hypothetical protein